MVEIDRDIAKNEVTIKIPQWSTGVLVMECILAKGHMNKAGSLLGSLFRPWPL